MSEKTRIDTTSAGNTLGLLGVAFVILKLTHIINWSWAWVTLPFWGGLAVAVLLLVALAAIAATLALFGGRK